VRAAVVRVEAALVVSALLMTACVRIESENVTHNPGRVTYPGYSIDYVDASPSPGSPVVQGDVVNFRVKVRYSLMCADRGRIQLQFTDQNGNPFAEISAVARDITRAGSAVAEISQEVTIPVEKWDLVLCAFVVPEGEAHPLGGMRIRYPVNPPRHSGER